MIAKYNNLKHLKKFQTCQKLFSLKFNDLFILLKIKLFHFIFLATLKIQYKAYGRKNLPSYIVNSLPNVLYMVFPNCF